MPPEQSGTELSTPYPPGKELGAEPTLPTPQMLPPLSTQSYLPLRDVAYYF